MSRRARKVFRATVIEGFGGLIFLMLVGAALPRLVDTGNRSAQDNATQQVQNALPDANPQRRSLPITNSPQAIQQPVANDKSTTVQPQALWGRIGWEQKIRVQPQTRVFLTDRRSAFE